MERRPRDDELSAFTLIFGGVSYAISAGSSALQFIWFDAATSVTVLQAGATAPNTGATPNPLFVCMTETDFPPPDATGIFLTFARWSTFG